MKKYLILSLIFMGCRNEIKFPEKQYLKSNCQLIGYWDGNDAREGDRVGYKCSDSLEYWVYIR